MGSKVQRNQKASSSLKAARGEGGAVRGAASPSHPQLQVFFWQNDGDGSCVEQWSFIPSTMMYDTSLQARASPVSHYHIVATATVSSFLPPLSSEFPAHPLC